MAREKVKIEVGPMAAPQAAWTKETFEAFIETYKCQSPIKYESRKAELEKQLATLK